MKVTFLGLGVMGYPMAGHLMKAGHDVTVYNRTATKSESWVKEHGGAMAKTPCEAAKGSEIVFCCVGNDNDLKSVVLGENGGLAGMNAGSLFVDHTTASAEVARELYDIAKGQGVDFIDAPVSGGQAGAENGVLTVMCGGDQAPFDRAAPVIDAFARSCKLMGSVGAGQQTKMVNQIAIAGLLQGLSEAMNFGQKAGLDMNLVLDVISKGAAGSWQMENRGSTMCEDKFDFGFAVDWMRKDLAICLAEGEKNKARLPMTAMVDQLYAQVQDMGGGRWDTSSLMKLLTR